MTEGGKRRTVYLHRLIMNAPTGVKVDHRDGNGLNCVRSNLRIATDSQSAANTRRTDNKTGYRGVSKAHRGTGYQAQLRIAGKLKHVGTYPTAEEAARAYDAAAVQNHGEFASLNFPKMPEMGIDA